MPRLGYTKSRTGCLRCRQRRVKCDEKRPCTACTRHHVPCSLITNPPVVPEPAHDSRPKRTRRKTVQPDAAEAAAVVAGTAGTDGSGSLPSILDQLPALTTTAALSPDSSIQSPSSSLSTPVRTSPSASSWAADLGLMHHYCTVTSLTLPRARETDSVRRVWQSAVVELALTQDALLHQLLAVAAFHLAQLRPAQRKAYSILASQHQGHAVQKLRSEVGNVTAENCHVLFATSSLLIIGGYAMHAMHAVPPGSNLSSAELVTTTTEQQRSRPPARPRHHQLTIDDLLGVFMLSRGMNAVLQIYEPTVQLGPLADLFQMNVATPPPVSLLTALRQRLYEMQVLVAQDAALERSHMLATGSGISTLATTTVEAAIYSFITVIDSALLKASEPELRVTMLLPIVLSDAFLELLRARHPMALAVFACHVAVLHRASEHGSVWYLRGFAAALADDIDQAVADADDAEGAEGAISLAWKAMIDWPLQYVRGQITLDGTTQDLSMYGQDP